MNRMIGTSSLFSSLNVTAASCSRIVFIVNSLPSSQALRSAAVYKGEMRPAWK